MNIPNFPTDNLYKFIAISGLILILVSMVIPFIKSEEILLQTQKDSLKLSIFEIQSKYLDENVEFLKSRMEKLLEENKDTKFTNEDKEDAIKLQNDLMQLEIDLANIKNKNNITEESLNTLRNLRKTFSLVGVLGFVLATFGFLMWYVKLQFHLDKIIEKQSEAPVFSNITISIILLSLYLLIFLSFYLAKYIN